MIDAIYHVDSFTNRAFSGNPAGVCLLGGPADEAWMQAMAAEINVAETAFLYPDGDRYQLRWFTPRVEVDLCGHATLASAHILWESGRLARDRQARFMTRSGELSAVWRDNHIEMDFPALATEECPEPPGLLDALGVTAQYIGRGKDHYLVHTDSEVTVRAASPDFSAVLTATDTPIILTAAASSQEYDIVSRFFAPAIGIPEDPVTGFAHCCLGPYWQDRLGKADIQAFQASARGGELRLKMRDRRVSLLGTALTIFRLEVSAAASRGVNA